MLSVACGVQALRLHAMRQAAAAIDAIRLDDKKPLGVRLVGQQGWSDSELVSHVAWRWLMVATVSIGTHKHRRSLLVPAAAVGKANYCKLLMWLYGR